MPEKLVTLYNFNWTYGQTHQCPPGGAIIPQQVFQLFCVWLGPLAAHFHYQRVVGREQISSVVSWEPTISALGPMML